MRNIISIVAAVVLLTVGAGCTTIYKAAVDERSVKTIASDTKIKATIVKAYVDDEKIKTLDIFAACYEGHVYLVGEYETTEQKSRAVDIAKKVEGVEDVTTYLLPKKKDDPCPDLKISAKVKAELIKDKEIWSTNIDVKSVQCNVVLVGLVGSKTEVDRAITHARGIEGAKSVKSYLRTVK